MTQPCPSPTSAGMASIALNRCYRPAKDSQNEVRMFNLDPDQTSLLVQYVSTVAADLTKTGFSRLSASVRRDRPAAAQVTQDRERNLTVQSILQSAGVNPATAEKIGQFLIHNGSISYLMYLAYVSKADEIANDTSVTERTNYTQAFEQELRAHLTLEAQIPDEDLDAVTNVLADVLMKSATAQIRDAKRLSIGRSADKVSALFLFSETKTRSALFSALGEPSLASFQDYSHRYVERMADRYGYVSLQHLGQDAPPIELRHIYVEPTLTESVSPEVRIDRRIHDEPPQTGEMTIQDAFAKSARTIVLGPAGVGKSTLVKHSVSLITQDSSEDPPIPLVLELKNYQDVEGNGSGLFKHYLLRDITKMMQHEPPEGWIDYLLLTGRATVFFDGYDEVLDSFDRARVRDAIRSFARLYPASSIVVTTRIVGYQETGFSSKEFMHVAINDFQPHQVKAYAKKWFDARPTGAGTSESSSIEAFFRETGKYAADLRANPLMLSLLCTLFYHQGDIPKTLAAVYESCASLMFKQWSVMRGLKDPGVWDLRPALSHIASVILGNRDYRRDGIPRRDLIQELQDFFREESTIRIETARDRAESLVAAWAGRAWVITEVGKDANNIAKFGFVHQSFLEYFAAVQLVTDSENAQDLFNKLRDRLVQVNGWYVAQIAVAVWAQWRRGRTFAFGEALLKEVEVARPREALNLLLFLASLREFVTFSPNVDRLFIHSCLKLYIRSLTPLTPGANLSSLNRATRNASPDFDDDYFVTHDVIGPGNLHEFSVYETPEDALSAPVTTLQSERTLSTLVPLALSDAAQWDLLLECISETPEWDIRPGETFVTVAFLGFLMRAGLTEAQGIDAAEANDALYAKLEELYSRVDSETSYWPAHAAAHILGLIDELDTLARIPWNSVISQEPVVLSFIMDFEVNGLVYGDIVTDYLHVSDYGDFVLSAVGRSFLKDLRRVRKNYDQLSRISAYDSNETIQIFVDPNSDIPVSEAETGERGVLVLAGMFVLMGIVHELGRALNPASFVSHGQTVPSPMRALLTVMDRSITWVDEKTASDLSSKLGSELLRDAVLKWRAGQWQLTDRVG